MVAIFRGKYACVLCAVSPLRERKQYIAKKGKKYKRKRHKTVVAAAAASGAYKNRKMSAAAAALCVYPDFIAPHCNIQGCTTTSLRTYLAKQRVSFANLFSSTALFSEPECS